jgi:hypothetical protein
MAITRQGSDLEDGPEHKDFNAIKLWVVWAAQAAKSVLVMWPITAPLRRTKPGKGPRVGEIQTISSPGTIYIVM